MKTINFELSKRLNDLWLLDNIETQCIYFRHKYFKKWEYILEDFIWNIIYDKKNCEDKIKTLTLEEAIEFLWDKYFMQISWWWFNKNIYNICIIIKTNNIQWEWETLLEAIEKIIEYLLDNNLLTK